MQGSQVWSLIWEDPTYLGAAKHVHQNYWAHVPEPVSCHYWALAPRAFAPQQEKPPLWEALTPPGRIAPLTATRKNLCSNKDPAQPLKNNNKMMPIPGDSDLVGLQ